MMKNYEIIGMRLTYDNQAATLAARDDWNPDLLQDMTVNDAKEIACVIHLGYVGPNDVKHMVRDGAEWVVDYFGKGDVRTAL